MEVVELLLGGGAQIIGGGAWLQSSGLRLNLTAAFNSMNVFTPL